MIEWLAGRAAGLEKSKTGEDSLQSHHRDEDSRVRLRCSQELDELGFEQLVGVSKEEMSLTECLLVERSVEISLHDERLVEAKEVDPGTPVHLSSGLLDKLGSRIPLAAVLAG